MIFQKRSPGLRWRFASPWRHQAGNSPLWYLNSQLEQFTMNSRCAPEGISLCYTTDKSSDFRANPGTTNHFNRLLILQNSLNPFLFHLITVWGLTIIKDFFQSPHKWESSIQKKRSLLRICGLLQLRLKTISCWRSAMFSKASWDMMSNLDTRAKSTFCSLFIMAEDCGRIRVKCQ